MSEVAFPCRITAVHPHYDPFGNEYVCVEFSVEAQRPPSVIQMPRGAPEELSAVIPIISQIPKMMVQGKAYSNRFVLFLTVQEWEKMERKYQYGDDAEVTIGKDGSIHVRVVQG
ncbi:arcadin 1 [Candidatus Bathyarchaeota archaeon]|jgi:hypothetical protein|nr:arcadin 1 [Candidatus Bathyarchaeota archaeon]